MVRLKLVPFLNATAIATTSIQNCLYIDCTYDIMILNTCDEANYGL